MTVDKIGLLPHYLKLYDDTCAEMRPRIERFAQTIRSALAAEGLNVELAPICRLKEEFQAAVEAFEQQDVACIVTLHLAYSPSLESADVLAATKLPLIVLDTTENYAFDNSVDADEILYNHGIHGVQDLCNLLRRRNKSFQIFAGHYSESDVLSRAARACRSAIIAKRMRTSRVGLVGDPFAGMGDFYVPFDELKRDIGMEVVCYDDAEGAARIAAVTQSEIDAEYAATARFLRSIPA
jgi:L-arabinose isomerase